MGSKIRGENRVAKLRGKLGGEVGCGNGVVK